MAKLSREDILKLAKLARLKLDESEIDKYRGEISEILEYVEMLEKVDVSGLTPTNQVTGLSNVTRNDQVIDYGYDPRDLLNNVPEVEANMLKVKRMVG